MSARLKQALLGTAIGRAAIWARETVGLHRKAVTEPEKFSAAYNDRLATHLVTNWPCKVFLDVGAHLGSVTAAVRYHNPGAKVIAVEAMPDKVNALRRKFPGVEVIHCAAGDSTGEVEFFVRPAATGYSSLIPSTGSIAIRVPSKRLDDVVLDRIDVMKIDVEGAELGVLRGAQRLVDTLRPIIMFESAPDDPAGAKPIYSKSDLWEWFAAHHYEVLVPDRMAHNGPALDRQGFIEAHYFPRRTTNYFAVPKGKRDDARDMSRSLHR